MVLVGRIYTATIHNTVKAILLVLSWHSSKISFSPWNWIFWSTLKLGSRISYNQTKYLSWFVGIDEWGSSCRSCGSEKAGNRRVDWTDGPRRIIRSNASSWRVLRNWSHLWYSYHMRGLDGGMASDWRCSFSKYTLSTARDWSFVFYPTKIINKNKQPQSTRRHSFAMFWLRRLQGQPNAHLNGLEDDEVKISALNASLKVHRQLCTVRMSMLMHQTSIFVFLL